jgi:hypothetical protein
MIKPLLDIYRMSMLNRPEGSRKEARDYFIEQMKSDPTYLEMLARNYFDRRAIVMPLRKTDEGYTFQRVDVKVESIEEARERREAAAKRTATAYDERKARLKNIILLDLPMPNGKLLRDATGAECQKAGGFLRAVGACIKPTQVVDKHMTEENLRDIRARFYQANKKRMAG